MSVALLDVNVLVSLFWDEHPHHAVCSEWFSQHQHAGWATCPLTEAGCARIMSNPAFSVRAPSFGEVVALLRQAAESSKTHQFWPANLPITALAALEYANLGHQQITDAYLLTLAVRRERPTGHNRSAHS